MRHGVSSGRRRRRQGTRGPSCSGCSPGTPRSTSCTSPPTPTRGAAVGDLYPVARGRVRRGSQLAPLDAADLARARRRVPRAAARRVAGARARRCVDDVAHVVDLGADFRLPGRRVRAVVRRRAHGARADRPVRVRARRALPRRARTARARRRARLLPDRGRASRCAPLLAGGLVEPTGIIADAMSGVSGAGRGLKTGEPLLRGERERHRVRRCSRTATPRRWSRRSRRSRGDRRPGAVHAAPRADDARHPRHLLRRARPRGGLSTARLLEHYRDFYAGEPFVVRGRRAAAHEGDATARTSRTSPCASTTAPAPSSRSRLKDNLVKGASGQAIQNANLLLGLPETTGFPSSGCCRERHGAPTGLRRGRARVRDQDRRARPTSRSSRPTDRRAGARGARVHDEPRARRAGAGEPRPPRRRPRRRGRARAPATPTRRPGERGPARRPPHVRAHRATALGVAADDVLVCSTGLIGIPLPMDAARGRASRRCAATLGADGGDAPPRPMLTTDTVRKEAVASSSLRHRGHRRRHGQGRGDAVARDGDDARGAHHRRRRRPARAAPRRWPRGRRDSSTACRRRLHEHERHRARARERPGRERIDGSGTRTRRAHRRADRASAGRSPSRWRATPRARPSSSASSCAGAALRRRGAPSRRAPSRDSQLVQCSLNGEDPYWGRVLSELGASGAQLRSRSRSTSPTTASRCAATASRADARRRRARARSWRALEIEIVCDLHAGARRGDGALHRPLATRTSTRTGARRDATDDRSRACARRRREGDDPRRGAARTSASSPARPSSSSTAATRWTTPSSPTCSRQDVVLMRLVGMNPVVVHGGGPADQRPHAPARQGTRVRRRPARHRRRDRRHRAHGARRQGEPRDRRVGQPARLVRGRALGRGRRAHPRRRSATPRSASSATSARSTRRSSSGCCARS